MKPKVLYRVNPQSDATFEEGLQKINSFTSTLPTVSKGEKKGRKMSKKVKEKLQMVIDNHAVLENFMALDFNPQNIVDNKAAYESNENKVTDMQKQIDTLLNANTKIGMDIDTDYRAYYAASIKAANENAALKSLSADLGVPFKKSSSKKDKKSDKPT